MFDDINIIRVTASLEPASGSNLVLPPTYEGGAHNLTAPRPDGSSEWASVDSPASFANRVEAALWGAFPGLAPLRVKVAQRDELSTIQMPHRCYDAILRESTLDGVPFPQTPIGQAVRASRSPHVEALFKYDPLVLLFGGWNSTALGERQPGPEAKFAAALSGEITATDVVPAGRAASRIDPLGIEGTATNLVEFADGTLEPYDPAKHDAALEAAENAKPKAEYPRRIKPSEANLGNVTPSIKPKGVRVRGGITLNAMVDLRRLRRYDYGLGDGNEEAVRLLALAGLYGITAVLHDGLDLRRDCSLVPNQAPEVVTLPRGWGEPKPLNRNLKDLSRQLAEQFRRLTPPIAQPVMLTGNAALASLV